MRNLAALTACSWLVLLGIGCGQKDPELAPVRGQVFYHGQPLNGGTLVFTPDPERGGHGPIACAEIKADGRYELRTGTQAGAVVGWHRVTVAAASASPATAEDVKPPVPVLPRKYSDPTEWGECREVKPGEVNVHDLRLD